MNKLTGLLIVLAVAYSLFVGNGVNPTVAALIVMASLDVSQVKFECY